MINQEIRCNLPLIAFNGTKVRENSVKTRVHFPILLCRIDLDNINLITLLSEST